MSSLNTFTLAGSSYWARDLVLPIALAFALPLVVVMVGLLSAVRMITRTGRDPVGTLRKERKPASYLAYVSSAGIVAGPAAMFWASNADFTLSAWLITAGMLLSVVGLEGLISDRGGRFGQAARRLDAGAGGRITDVSGWSRSRAGCVRYVRSRPSYRVLHVCEHRQSRLRDRRIRCVGTPSDYHVVRNRSCAP